MSRLAVCLGAIGLWAGAVAADETADITALLEALQVEKSVEIMRAEGLEYGAGLAEEMLPGVSQEAWAQQVSRIYDVERMTQEVTDGLVAALPQEHMEPVLAFLTSDTGRQIVTLELSAREAFLDPGTEDAAVEHFEEARDDETPLYQQVQILIEDSSLIEFNVMGALNANLMFYRGLDEGGAIEMGEAEMLSDVWAQEDAVRAESAQWLGAFLMMAYRPLEPDALEAYAEYYRTDEGRALNAALFKAYDAMYAQISYLLGLAVAQQMTSEEL